MLEHSVYSVISPERLSSILFKDVSKSRESSEVIKLTSKDLYDLNIIDKVINEPINGDQENITSIAKNIK